MSYLAIVNTINEVRKTGKCIKHTFLMPDCQIEVTVKRLPKLEQSRGFKPDSIIIDDYLAEE